MSESSKSNHNKTIKPSSSKPPELSILAAKQFPQDFFGDDCAFNQRNNKRYPSINRKDNSIKAEMRQETRMYKHYQTECNDDCIQEVIVEPEIQEAKSKPMLKPKMGSMPYDGKEGLSHRCQNAKELNLNQLDFLDEPSTSGSYQGLNQMSNENTPTCLESQLSGLSSLMNRDNSDYNYNYNNSNSNGNLFKETAHFFRCETEVQEREKDKEPIRHCSARSDLPKPFKPETNQKIFSLKPQTPRTPQTSQLSQTRNSNKRTKANERLNTAGNSSNDKSGFDSMMQCIQEDKQSKVNKTTMSIPYQRPKSVMSRSRPVIKTKQMFSKELVSLIDNVPKEYIEDPEIKKGINILLKNLNDFKEVINNKKNICEKEREQRNRKETHKPINSYKRAINKQQTNNNKPIKIINTNTGCNSTSHTQRKKSIKH